MKCGKALINKKSTLRCKNDAITKMKWPLTMYLATTSSRVISENSWYLTSFNLSFLDSRDCFFCLNDPRVRLSLIWTIEPLLFGCLYYSTGMYVFQLGILNENKRQFLCRRENLRGRRPNPLTSMFFRCYNKNIGRFARAASVKEK